MRRGLDPIQPFFVNNTTKYYKMKMPNTPFVHFYAFTVDTDTECLSAAIPDGCADILIIKHKDSIEGYLYGYVTKLNPLVLPLGTQCFGVRFRPGYLPSRLGVSLPEIANTRISLDVLPGGKELIKKVVEAENFLEQTEVFKNYVKDQWLYNDLLLQFIEVINSNDTIRITEMEKKTLYSARYINKVFAENIGLSPKAFAKHVRLQRLLGTMNNENCPCLSELAALFGYFDQSHFYKEFKELTAITPGEYFNAVDLSYYKQKLIYV